nr:ribonuclease H-like domain-containing protein [Tanacetum cinerariifolium]
EDENPAQANIKQALSRYKARLVANGQSQQQGIDCDETFSLVVKPATIRTVLSLAPPGFVDSTRLDYRTESGLFLSQSKFAEEILEIGHMQHCNLYKTPVDTESKLGPDGDPVSDSTLYLCLYIHDPREPHVAALKRIIQYVYGTLDHGLQFYVSTTTQLTTYTDADWVGWLVTRRSTSGYYVILGDNPLSWSAKRHITVSRSSTEAEY